MEELKVGERVILQAIEQDVCNGCDDCFFGYDDICCNHFIAKQYTHVLFINGYRKDSPRIEKEIESISIGKPKKGLCPDKWLDTEFFIIKFK